MSKKPEDASKMSIVKSRGNVFADLGLPNADEELAKAELAFTILRRIEAKQLTQEQAANLLEADQVEVALLINGRVGDLTIDRLARFLNALEMNVQITVAPTGSNQRGKTLVQVA